MAAPKDLKTLREFLSQSHTQLCAFVDGLEEPFRSQFAAVKEQYNTLLASMPPSDMVKAATEGNWNLDCLWSCLMSMQGAVTATIAGINGLRDRYASALTPAQVEAKVAEVIASKVKAAELFPAAQVQQLCSDAKSSLEATLKSEFAAREEQLKKDAEAAVKSATERVGLVGKRASLLASESFPLPADEAILGLPEEQFVGQKTIAQSRKEKLMAAGASGELLASVWLPEAEYGKQEKVILKALECGRGRGGGEEMFMLPPGQVGGKEELPSF